MPRQQSKSIFDLPDSSQSNAACDSQGAQPTYTESDGNSDAGSTAKAPYETDASSIFTQSTTAPTITPEVSTSKSRFSFLNRSKSSNKDDTTGLLPEQNAAKKNKGPFSMFKPHEPTEKDLEIAQRIRERLGSQEEAIRKGGSQPAGYKGINGGAAMGQPWVGGI